MNWLFCFNQSVPTRTSGDLGTLRHVKIIESMFFENWSNFSACCALWCCDISHIYVKIEEKKEGDGKSSCTWELIIYKHL